MGGHGGPLFLVLENASAFSHGMDAEATFAMEFSHFEKKAEKDF
ncbi:MAG: hypothetical protein WCT14_00565 [Treponemataceae bacterium]